MADPRSILNGAVPDLGHRHEWLVTLSAFGVIDENGWREVPPQEATAQRAELLMCVGCNSINPIQWGEMRRAKPTVAG